jgi:hypothetical protein
LTKKAENYQLSRISLLSMVFPGELNTPYSEKKAGSWEPDI